MNMLHRTMAVGKNLIKKDQNKTTIEGLKNNIHKSIKLSWWFISLKGITKLRVMSLMSTKIRFSDIIFHLP